MIRCFLAALLLLAAPARAGEARFAVRLLGLPVGQLSLAARTSPAAYAASARFRTTGAVGLLALIRFDLSAQGRLVAGLPRPALYSEAMNTGRRRSSTQLTATRGALRPASAGATHAADPPPGALDPMTALWTALRDQPAAALCALDAPVFDGTRQTHIRLTTRHVANGTVTCSGTFTRLKGYSPAELAERRRFPVSVTYAPQGPLWRARSAMAQTLHGKARLLRLD